MLKTKKKVDTISTKSDSIRFTAKEDGFVSIGVVCLQGETYDNVEVSIKLEVGETSTPYSKWIDPTTLTVVANGKNYTPKADGTVEGLSSSALSSGITVNSGMMLECEYNRDINSVIDELYGLVA